MPRQTRGGGRHRARSPWRVLDLVVVVLSVVFVALGVGLAIGPGDATPATTPDPAGPTTSAPPASVVLDR